MEGWSKPPGLPGSEEPTRQMEPTPSLLRVAAVSKAPVQTDSAMMRAVKRNPVPMVTGLVVLAGAAGMGAYLLLRRPPLPLPPPSPSEPAQAAPPRAPPLEAPAGRTPTSEKRTADRAPSRGEAKQRRVRMNPEKIAVKGGLPHKTVSTDSKAVAEPRSAPKTEVAPPPEDLPKEAAPMTEEEMRAHGEASINADHVRFVVRSHMPQVRSCYDRANKDFNLAGLVEIGFAISQEGKAVKVRTEANTTGSDLLARCLEMRVKEWQFPRPTGGEYELIYPFQFGQFGQSG